MGRGFGSNVRAMVQGSTPPTTPGREIFISQKVDLTETAKNALLLSNDGCRSNRREYAMNQLRLDKRTCDVLDRIRHGSSALSVYEMPPDLAEAAEP
jgi:hypothetical protein